MTGNSHHMDIELFDNSSEDEDQTKDSQHGSTGHEQTRSPSQDLPEDFRSCNEAFTPRQSVEQDIFQEERKISHDNEPVCRPSSTVTSSERSALSSQDGSRSATLRPTERPSREQKKDSNDDDHSRGKHAMESESRTSPDLDIEVFMVEDPLPDSENPKKSELIYVGSLKVIREVDSDSARSPTLKSPTVEASAAVSKKRPSQGSITLLDRFDRDEWLRHNHDEEMDEVRVDEDGNYYVFGQGGFRVRLKEGQIQSDNTSQPFCVSKGKKVNIHIVADRFRTSALQGPRPVADEGPITPRTEPIVNNASDPLRSPRRDVTRLPNARKTSQKIRLQHSKTPWSDIVTGGAEKSKNAKTYLIKGARSKLRSSTSQPVRPQMQQQSTSQTTSRTSSANKSGLETGNSGESQGRRLGFLGKGLRVPPVANIKKRIQLRRY
ncbi:hypothetical protein BKA64DRAFT_759681 [Cadophora sp. MPI-SDFR-AT-0126]|nr:hypothetical protein BKA64DRAFT_759681 [Leotiomycetes sp. MPI-SDFR-AT-0126]